MSSDTGYGLRVAGCGLRGTGCGLRVTKYKVYYKNTESFYFVLSPFRVFVIGFNYFEAQIIRNLQTHCEVNLRHRAIIFKSV